MLFNHPQSLREDILILLAVQHHFAIETLPVFEGVVISAGFPKSASFSSDPIILISSFDLQHDDWSMILGDDQIRNPILFGGHPFCHQSKTIFDRSCLNSVLFLSVNTERVLSDGIVFEVQCW